MTISLIVAASTNNAIGKNNQLPWHLPIDLKFFKNTTWALPVIMGRKTFESMNGKPLPGRMNIVVTRQKDYKAEGAVVVHSIDDGLFLAKEADYLEAFIIGGGQLFEEYINKADRLYLTRVHTILDGDVFFPELDYAKWKQESKRDFFADEKHAYDFSIEVWERS